MIKIKKYCLSCIHFRPKDASGGICKKNKSANKSYPRVVCEDLCDSWKDSGQQYFIRRGWVNSQKERRSWRRKTEQFALKNLSNKQKKGMIGSLD